MYAEVDTNICMFNLYVNEFGNVFSRTCHVISINHARLHFLCWLPETISIVSSRPTPAYLEFHLTYTNASVFLLGMFPLKAWRS